MYADDSSGVRNDSNAKLAEAEADVAAGRVKFGWRSDFKAEVGGLRYRKAVVKSYIMICDVDSDGEAKGSGICA